MGIGMREWLSRVGQGTIRALGGPSMEQRVRVAERWNAMLGLGGPTIMKSDQAYRMTAIAQTD